MGSAVCSCCYAVATWGEEAAQPPWLLVNPNPNMNGPVTVINILPWQSRYSRLPLYIF